MADEKKKDEAKKGAKGAQAAEREEGDEGAAEAPAPKGKGKLLYLIGGAVVLLGVAGVAVAMVAMKHEDKKQEDAAGLAPESAAQQEGPKPVAESSLGNEEDELEEGEEPLGAIFPMEPLVVNLAGGSYIRLQAQVEFTAREIPRRFYARLVLVRDSMITLLSQKRADDLITPKGKDQLRGELRDIVNEALHKQDAKKVYFTQFVVQ
jgi:flagellar FliL protein